MSYLQDVSNLKNIVFYGNSSLICKIECFQKSFRGFLYLEILTILISQCFLLFQGLVYFNSPSYQRNYLGNLRRTQINCVKNKNPFKFFGNSPYFSLHFFPSERKMWVLCWHPRWRNISVRHPFAEFAWLKQLSRHPALGPRPIFSHFPGISFGENEHKAFLRNQLAAKNKHCLGLIGLSA